jgi:uncharacterized damage-inducible protein DinB
MFEPFIIDKEKKDIYHMEYNRWSNSSVSTEEETISSFESSTEEEGSKSCILKHIIEKEKEYINRTVSCNTKRDIPK